MTPLEYFDAYAHGYQPYKSGAWCYEDGLIYRGLVLLHQATGDQRFLEHCLRLINDQIAPDGSLKGYRQSEYNIDNVMAGRSLFYLGETTGDGRYMRAADRLAAQLASHPRTTTGNYWHKKIYEHQVWLDGLYMGLPFQIDYGRRTDDQALVTDALEQISRALDLTSTKDGLYVHGYDEARAQQWADPETGKSPACWARALGWLAMALVDAIALASADDAEAFGLVSRTQALFERVAELQGEDSKWLQVIDRPDLEGNYPESSASVMFAYAFLKAGRIGIWAPGRVLGDAALQALYDTAMSKCEDGVSRFEDICHVAGLGGFSGVYRDGSPEYYLTEDIVADDSKGVGPLMMAHSERMLFRGADGASEGSMKAAE
ncbi:glycoside hydrolase family 88/105 protein [Roseibium sp.]|uniref:glycoside hydrolase family 88/105 protein n=1 Tax=Roseibium sp. TaxID=1936156 RepID=UPI003A9770E1